MLKDLLNYLENKSILILGFGMEGESSYRFLRKHFPEKNLFIADKNINLLDFLQLTDSLIHIPGKSPHISNP